MTRRLRRDRGQHHRGSPRRWRVKAQTEIATSPEEFKTHFAGREYDTIGGLLLQKFGRGPKRGDRETIDDLAFEIARPTVGASTRYGHASASGRDRRATAHSAVCRRSDARRSVGRGIRPVPARGSAAVAWHCCRAVRSSSGRPAPASPGLKFGLGFSWTAPQDLRQPGTVGGMQPG